MIPNEFGALRTGQLIRHCLNESIWVVLAGGGDIFGWVTVQCIYAGLGDPNMDPWPIYPDSYFATACEIYDP